MQGHILGLIVVLGAVTAFPQADKSGSNSKFEEWQELCLKEAGFNKSAVIDVDNIPRSAKCFAACILEKEGSLKASGSLDVEVVKNTEIFNSLNLNERGITDKLRNVLEECAKDGKILAEDKCETADNFLMCVKEKALRISSYKKD